MKMNLKSQQEDCYTKSDYVFHHDHYREGYPIITLSISIILILKINKKTLLKL